MLRSGEMRGREDAQVIPTDEGRRGVLGGEVDGVGVLRLAGNRTPELKTAAGDFGRRRTARSGAIKISRPCENDADGENREKGSGDRVRGRRCSPKKKNGGGGSAGSGDEILRPGGTVWSRMRGKRRGAAWLLIAVLGRVDLGLNGLQ